MKTFWVLMYIYSGHAGHRDGTHGPQMVIPYNHPELYSETDLTATCKHLAVLYTASMHGTGKGPTGKRGNDFFRCEKVKR